jgi:hypothetical protein
VAQHLCDSFARHQGALSPPSFTSCLTQSSYYGDMTSQDPGLLEIDKDSHTVQSLSVADPGTPLYAALPGYMHIRLLSLVSESVLEHPILRCNFIVQDIRKVIPWAGYNALSYVWGSSPERMLIICNNHELSITRNLYNALVQIWAVTPRQLLWADAVCINQKDDVEKGLQVGVMGEIYKAATTVLVWLGDEEESIAESWDIVQKNAKEPRNLKKTAFDILLAHPWFTRAWTLQEVLLARKAVLLCGTRWIDWRLLIETIGPRGPLEAMRKCTEIMQSDLNPDHNRGSRNLFKELLIASSIRDASDPRDKIYALLGLLTHNSVHIRPDYTISYWQLVSNFVRDHAGTSTGLWFLHGCGTDLELSQEFSVGDLRGSQGEKPSWLPDLLHPRLLKRISERYIFPTLSGAYLLNDFDQPVSDKLLRTRGIPFGVFVHDIEQHRDSWSIMPLPKCIVGALSHGAKPGRVDLLFKGPVESVPSHAHRYLDHIVVKLNELESDMEAINAWRLSEYQENHDRSRCSCLKGKWSSFRNVNRVRERGPCLISPRSLHHNVRSGDLLCILADEDGCFALRHPPSPTGVFQLLGFQLVGSAFVPPLGRAAASTGVAHRWPIPSKALLFDLC